MQINPCDIKCFISYYEGFELSSNALAFFYRNGTVQLSVDIQSISAGINTFRKRKGQTPFS